MNAFSHPQPDDPDGIVAQQLRRWVFLSADCEFYHRQSGERMSRAAFDLAMAKATPWLPVMKHDGQLAMKKLAPSKALLEHLEGLVVANTMYRPDIKSEVFDQDGIRFLNSYLPASVTPTDPAWERKKGWRICEDHVRNILPDDADTIIAWMAHNVQRPGVKIAWAPVIVGAQGDGKTTMAVHMLQAAMGKPHVQTVSLEAMFSDFTGWAEGACVKVLDEIRVHGTARATAMDKLKPLITNDSVEIVRKGRDGRQIVNVTNYIATTNHMDALAVDEGDRRWAIFRTRFAGNEDVKREIDQGYWEALYGVIRGQAGAIRGWLMSINLSAFDRNAAPETSSAKRTMIEAARPSSEVEVREALAIGGEGVADDVLATDRLNEIILKQSGRAMPTTVLSRALDRCGWTKFESTVKWRGMNRRCYYRPSQFEDGQSADALRSAFRLKLDLTLQQSSGEEPF